MINFYRFNYKFIFKNTLSFLVSISLVALFHNLYIRLSSNRIFHERDICDDLQNKILSLNSNMKDDFSVTVINDEGIQIIDINSFMPLIPASNLKLFTTAYALDKLTTKFKLQTRLVLDSQGEFHLFGSGDPDINSIHISLLSKEIGNYIRNNNYMIKRPYVLSIHEAKVSNWWPDTWSNIDRNQIYGAPITKLPYSGNSTNTTILDPTKILKNRLGYLVGTMIADNQLIINFDRSDKSFVTKEQASTVFTSSPMQSLLSLANSESHNFTAEVLLRNASGTWNNDKATRNLTTWINNQGIRLSDISIYDGSGLSRMNRLTTYSISSLLWKMSNHRSWYFYKSTLSVLGIKGTLTNFEIDDTIKGRFYGKTGTLDGVRSISGVLDALDGRAFISVISNNHILQDDIISQIIKLVFYSSSCL